MKTEKRVAKNKLGLPPEYKKQPEYFDAFNINDDTDAKNAVIEKLLKAQGVKSVLDITCGTGSQVFHLIEEGYEVTGSDFSPALLEIARDKARKKKLDVSFIDGDMRNIKMGRFDGVISIFNAVGHLTKTGFGKAMRNIHGNLSDGGVYIFDILNLSAMTDKLVADFAYHIHAKAKDSQIHAVQCSTVDRESGRLVSYNYDITQLKAETPKMSQSKCELQIYTANELTEMLGRNGFEVLSQCGLDGSTFHASKTVNILTVAKKIPR